MIEFGKTLIAAREAKGITVSQLAEITHLPRSVVENLEKESFSSFAAPIYGRGFVKLYCEAVGLDPKPMIEEFMEIHNGNRSLAIKERAVVSPSIPPPPPPPTPPDPTPAPPPQPELFEPQPTSNIFSRYATPMRKKFNTFKLDTFLDLNIKFKRWAILGAIVLVLLWLVIAGIVALYHATTSSTSPSASTVEVDNTNRTPIKIQPLYID